MQSIARILLCLLVAGSTAMAFAPVPYYTLYGIVRDQVGQTIMAQRAENVLLKGGVGVRRTPSTSSQFDQNYQLCNE